MTDYENSINLKLKIMETFNLDLLKEHIKSNYFADGNNDLYPVFDKWFETNIRDMGFVASELMDSFRIYVADMNDAL